VVLKPSPQMHHLPSYGQMRFQRLQASWVLGGGGGGGLGVFLGGVGDP